jgi:DNA repair exonuclease SbcCD ATPase subunit
MIKRIQIIGLRGKSFDLGLEPVTLIIGPNKSGKTTIADAMRWALLGYIPGMPAPPRGWAELVGNGTTEVSVMLEDHSGSAMYRSMRLEKGAVRLDTSRAQPTAFMNVLTLDPGHFFGAPGPRRAQIVAEASAGEFDWKAQVSEALWRWKFGDYKRWQDWIGQAIDGAKSERSQWADKKKTLGQTLRGLESIREIVVEDDAGKTEEVAKCQQRLGGLQEQMKAVEEQIDKIQHPAQNTAQGALDAIRRALQEFLGRSHDEDTYTERLKDCEMKLDELKTAEEIDARTLAKWRSDLVKLGNDVAIEESRILQLEQSLQTIEAKYAKLRKVKQCPTCGSTGKGLSEALKTAQKAETETQKAYLEAAERARERVKLKHEDCNERVNNAQAYLDKRAEAEIELANLKDEARLIDLWKEHDRLVAELKNETAPQYDIDGLQERKYEISCEIEDAAEAAGVLQHALSELAYKRSQKRQLAEIEAQLEAAEQAWEQSNNAAGELEKLRERWTAMSLEPVLSRLTIFTEGIFEQPLSMDGTELGRMVGSRWVPLTQFSGSEQAVAVAGMTCALQGSGEHSIVLADELSSFDDEHLAKFLKNVGQAVKAGVLEQFIGFSTPRKSLEKVAGKNVLVKTI